MWAASDRLPPTTEPGVGLILTQFLGTIDDGMFTKILGPGTTIEPVQVGALHGYWITGQPHQFFYEGPNGFVDASRRLVGDVLLWADGPITYRLETSLGRDWRSRSRIDVLRSPGPAALGWWRDGARSRARATIDWWRSSPPPEPTSPLRRFSGIGGKVRDDQPSRTGAHSMPRSRVLIIAGVVIVAAVAIGGFLVYDQVLRGDNVAALTLPSAAPSPAASTATAATDPSGDPTAAPSTGAAASVAGGGSTGDVAGTWTVATGSQAGYRVTEQLANCRPSRDAVGRTDKVTGTITLTSSGSTTTLTAADLTVDTTSISSDKSQRDNRLRNEGLQTDTYPTATFKLTQPVAVPAAALPGTPSTSR